MSVLPPVFPNELPELPVVPVLPVLPVLPVPLLYELPVVPPL